MRQFYWLRPNKSYHLYLYSTAFRLGQCREDAQEKGEILPFPKTNLDNDYSLPDITEILRRQSEEQGDDNKG